MQVDRSETGEIPGTQAKARGGGRNRRVRIGIAKPFVVSDAERSEERFACKRFEGLAGDLHDEPADLANQETNRSE